MASPTPNKIEPFDDPNPTVVPFDEPARQSSTQPNPTMIAFDEPVGKSPSQPNPTMLTLDEPVSKSSSLPSDIFSFGGHVSAGYEETLGDPDDVKDTWVGKRMGPCMQDLMSNIYGCTMGGTYYCFAALFGICLSAMWGISFGMNNFCIVWYIQPMLKLFFGFLRVGYVMSRALFRIMLDPCFESFGMMFSKINGTLSIALPNQARKSVIREQAAISEV